MRKYARILTLVLVLAGTVTVGSAIATNCCTYPECPPNCKDTQATDTQATVPDFF